MHCDLDAFFAAVETIYRKHNPEIPLIIGSNPDCGNGRGIVSTCNYAAREYGIRSAMPISEAWRRCPGPPIGIAIYQKNRFLLYRRASRKVMHILKNNSDKFERASIDEAYIDVTNICEGDWDNALAHAKKLKLKIYQELGLSASFGIGSTRIIAKMGSEVNKPGGICRILPHECIEFLSGQITRNVPGIGPKTATSLAEYGVNKMQDAYELGVIGLSHIAGKRFANWIISVIEGKTSSEVGVLQSRKSVGKEFTFTKDIDKPEFVFEQLDLLVNQICKRLKELNVSGRTIEIKLRYQGFETLTHSKKIPVAMDDFEVFRIIAQRLLWQAFDTDRKVRLVGFRIADLEIPPSRQITLVNFQDN